MPAMTIKHNSPPFYAPSEQFPVRPRRGDMQNWIHLALPAHHAALVQHFGNPDTTIVTSEPAIGWNLRQRTGLLYPDLLIAFDVDRAASFGRLGYSLEEQGKPPDFVLEVGSPTTALNDYTTKRDGYAAFGIPEYWRFDPTDGERYPTGLEGDCLVDGSYRPMTIVRTDSNRLWGHSDVLNQDLCWEHGQLRWWDPVAQRYLLTYDEVRSGREAERQARRHAESQLAAERQARLAAEAEAAEAQARIRQLEDELRSRS